MAEKKEKDVPLVTIALITYNYAQFLKDAFESAANQDYQGNFEILIIDDGSTDNIQEVIETLKGKEFDYYRKVNGGVCSARNYGALKAKGKYIVFLDADNMLHPSFISKTLGILEKQPSSIGFVYTQLQYFGTEEKITNFREYDLEALTKSNFIDANALIKTELVKKYPYDKALTTWEDWDLYLTLGENGIYGVLLNEPYVLYRKHSTTAPSLIDRLDTQTKLKLRHRLINKHWRLFGLQKVIKHNILYLLARPSSY